MDTRRITSFALAACLATSGICQAEISFSDVSVAAKVNRANESYGASWGDFNGDAFPDIYANNHRVQDNIFVNLGNGTFFSIGPEVLTWRNHKLADTHGGTWSDLDNDGDQDLLVSAGTGNLSQLLLNDHQMLVDRTVERGLTTNALGGRQAVWFDYDGDKLPDFVMTQYGGWAKVYRQGPVGYFTDTTADTKLRCIRFHYGQLIDIDGDGHLDFLCADETRFPQKVYDWQPLPWKVIYDNQVAAAFLPGVPQSVDSAIADFNNDGRMDMFVIGNVQLRPSGVTQSDPMHFEAAFLNGIKGCKFTSTGTITFEMDWNKQDERFTVDFKRIKIGANAMTPVGIPFTLDPADPNVQGMPPAPTVQDDVPMMQIGYNASTHQWTVVIWSQLSSTSAAVFSEASLQIASTQPITGLTATGLWTGDRPQVPTLLMNFPGAFVNRTAGSGLDVPMQCVSVTPGDFDNDGDVDLFLACREAVGNNPDRLFENLGDGTFREVPNAGGAAGPVGAAVASGAGTGDSVVSADYDVDGFLDLFVTNGFNMRPRQYGGPNKLFHNNGNANHWVEFDLVGTQSDRDAIGARVFVSANGTSQLRENNGGYHRWSQDMKRLHFGVAGATNVSVKVEWPSGATQNFTNIATNKLYRLTEGNVNAAVVTPGGAAPYQCGKPNFNTAVEKGIFIWRDCPSREWRMKTAAGGGNVIYRGSITSSSPYDKVTTVGTGTADKVDYTTDSKVIAFQLTTSGAASDGIYFTPKDFTDACLRLDVPAGTNVYYGPFRKQLTLPLDLDTRGVCSP